MVSFLKGRRREDDSVVAVDSSGRNVTAALEALVARAEAAANDLRALAPILERAAELDGLRERCEEIERQVAGLDRLGAQLRHGRRPGRAGHQDPDGHRDPASPIRRGCRAAPGPDG